MNIYSIFETIKNNQFLMTGLGLSGAGILTFWLKDVPRKVYHFFKRELTTELIITSQNAIFHEVLKWIEKKYANKNFRRLKLSNGLWGYNKRTTTSIGYGFHCIKYKRTFLLINLSKEANSQSSYDKETILIIKIGRSRKLFDGLIKEIESLETDLNKTKIYKMEESWIHVKDQNKRSIDSIFIEKYKSDIIINRLLKFINSEEWYIKNGVPYQLGILLYGAAGTGKTSLIKAISGYLNYPIYYLSPQKLSKIENAMSILPEKCVVVIEDIDTNFLTRARREKSPEKKDATENDNNILEAMASVSLSEVLNSLDGMFSAHGRILIATTNHIENLDPALIRNGRIDIRVEVGFVNHEIFTNFMKNFFPNSSLDLEKVIRNINIKSNVTVAMLQDMILQEKSESELITFISE